MARRLAGRAAPSARTPDPRVERQHAAFVGQQRVDVELDHLGQVADHLRDLQQRVGQRLAVDRGAVAVAAPAARRTRVRADQVARQHAC